MVGINEFIKDNFSKAANKRDRCYVSPIDQKYLGAAIKAFRYKGDPSSILGIVDTTLFGNAKMGLLFTGERFFINEIGIELTEIHYQSILSAEVKVTKTTDKKGKTKTRKELIIATKQANTLRLSFISIVNFEGLAQLLNTIAKSFHEFSEQSQLQPIEDLDEELKVAYVKVIINMVFNNFGKVEGKEFIEILHLLSRLKVSQKARSSLRNYMANPHKARSNQELVKVIKTHSPDGMRHSLHVSLMKDLISVHSVVSGQISGDFVFIKQIRSILQVGDSEIELVVEAIKSDRSMMLDRSYYDASMKKSITDLSAKAAAVGVPLGAVYLSGSVVGMSAAGMSSGLATLGLGGVLGFSSMATGIGAVVFLGLVTYKGINSLASTGAEDGDKRRKIMFQEVMRQGHRTMQVIIEDMSSITTELSDAIKTRDEQSTIIIELEQLLVKYVAFAAHVNRQNQQAAANKQRLKSPEILDRQRLEACTSGPSKRELREPILSYYEERLVIKKNKQGKNIETTELKLKPSSSDEEMEKLGEMFMVIGYSSVTSAIKGEIKKRFGDGKENGDSSS